MKRVLAFAVIGLLGSVAAAQALDSDRVEGTGKEIKGNVEQGAGNLTGDNKLQNEGKTDHANGALQDAWGKVKDTARDVGTKVKDVFEGK